MYVLYLSLSSRAACHLTHPHITVINYLIVCYSQGYKQQRAFIIAQGPMQSTARDFWKMIHDRKCGVVVMLSDLVEAGKVGRSALAVVACSDVSLCASLPLQEVCYQYWPTSGSHTYGEFTVEILGEEKLQGFAMRTFGVFNAKVSLHSDTCTPGRSCQWWLVYSSCSPPLLPPD